ncbi:uncharacterized protein C8A04DRAFT_40394 [Dichotomopilus funicola]|uniref:Uncharacterized protein n=1 Tax=Dichotomopilus funicola TaxID=1934379 RepID=A0AAN6UW44_9PEZI|nr:hypothetical protein C8A04DRAFT_40394 [Dichotomopilus funicola]
MATAAVDTDDDCRHMGVYPRCGICAGRISRHERAIALFGDSNSTSYRGHTRPFPFPQPGYAIHNVDGYFLCRYPNCERCACLPEFAPIHFDCFEIFRQQCSVTESNALNRLRVLIHLSATMVDKDMLSTICGRTGLPRLHTLPPELLEKIRQYSKYAWLWRYILAFQLADYISASEPDSLRTVPLREIVFWERGGEFKRVMGPHQQLPTLRLTIDTAGISKIERISDTDVYAGECTGRFAFIVQREASIPDVTAQLKDGRLRLKLPVSIQTLYTWNTNVIPSRALSNVYPNDWSSCQNIYTVEMDRVKGIAFFYSHQNPAAMDTFIRFSNRLGRSLVWIYLPISQRDRVLALGIREELQSRRPSALFRTKLMGDTTIGPQLDGKAGDRYLAASVPLAMMYGEPIEGRLIRFFGGHCRVPRDGPLPSRRFLLINPGPCPIEDDRCFFSWAPLSAVTSTLVFYDQNTGFCRGILFHYRNGGSRAVGQCRLHVDPAKSVVQPGQLCFRTTSCLSRRDRPIYNVEVKFKQAAQTKPTGKDSDRWESRPMKGLVNFWFTTEASFLAIRESN